MNAIPKFIGLPDWIFFWCLFSIALVAIAKNRNSKVFSSFIQLVFTNSYLQVYTHKIHSRSLHFWMTLFFVTVFPLYIFFIQFTQGIYTELSLKQYGIYVLYVATFLILKRSIEYFLSISFLKNQGIQVFVFAKQSYLNYISLVFFLPILIIIYISFNIPYVIYFVIALFLVLWVLSYVLVLSKFRKQFGYQWFYFILYLCALELAPSCLTYIMILNGIE